MTAYQWKILGIEANGELITAARYFVTAKNKDISVSTEGCWRFLEPTVKTPFAEVTEDMVIEWVKAEAVRDGKSMILGRLDDQVTYLQSQTTAVAPWLPQTFTPEL